MNQKITGNPEDHVILIFYYTFMMYGREYNFKNWTIYSAMTKGYCQGTRGENIFDPASVRVVWIEDLFLVSMLEFYTLFMRGENISPKSSQQDIYDLPNGSYFQRVNWRY